MSSQASLVIRCFAVELRLVLAKVMILGIMSKGFPLIPRQKICSCVLCARDVGDVNGYIKQCLKEPQASQ